MFSNSLCYYHGTTDITWQNIKNSGEFIPSSDLGKYWVTKGVYFVAENPFIALWYAWVTTFRHNNNIHTITAKRHVPVVLKTTYAGDGKVLNLVSANGHMFYHNAHSMLKNKLKTKYFDTLDNIDSYVGVEIFSSGAYDAILAAFNEGKTFQRLIQGSKYLNPYGYNGHKYGDHVEICFSTYTNLDDITLHNHSDLVHGHNKTYWEHLCMALTECLPGAAKLKDFMRCEFYDHLLNQVTL